MGWLRPKRADRRLPDRLPANITGERRGGNRVAQFFAGNGGFDGARRDRINEDWQPGNVSPYSLHLKDAKFLRERARDLVLNNPHALSAVNAYIGNVVECGIAPLPQFDDADTRATWTDAWTHWAANEADLTETQHFNELQALWLTEIIVGGGCLVRYRTAPRTNRRRVQAALELIPEERFVDDNDTFLAWHRRRKSGNPISRGVELDAATGRAVAFWITTQDPNAHQVGEWGEPVRIPADQARYSFFRNRIGQVRGHTLLHAVIIWLWKLGYYTDNELMASAIKSCFAAMITTDTSIDTPDLLDGDPDGETTDIYGNALEKIQPGIIWRGRPGESIQGIGPNVPGSDSVAWLLMIQRSIAIGTNLSYEEIARDYSKGSFSSVRAAANADRKRFRAMQRFVIHELCEPSYKHFARWATLAGLDGFPSLEQFASDMDNYVRVRWQTPGWLSVNPREDAMAQNIRLANGSTTLEEIGGNEGAGWEQRLEQRAKELDKAVALGIPLESGGVTVGADEPMEEDA